MLLAVEGKVIFKASPRDVLSLRRGAVINTLSEMVGLLSTPFPSLQPWVGPCTRSSHSHQHRNQHRAAHPAFASLLRPGCSLVWVSPSQRFGRDGKQETIKWERIKCWAVPGIPLPGYTSSNPYTELKPLKEVGWATEQLWKQSPHFTDFSQPRK